MKAQPTTVLAARREFALHAHSLKKTRNDDGQIQECFSKLKELVPTIPKEKKLSKTQFLQHVIDYIFDLELALDSHPVMQLVAQNNNRTPLSESCRDNEQCLLQMVEKDERPVSC